MLPPSPSSSKHIPESGTLEGAAEDSPVPGRPLTTVGVQKLPEIVFGAASFSNAYNDNAYLESSVPAHTVRLALRYGIRAFDTSAYYGPSEIVLGKALQAVKAEFPRSSYQLMTKCGRYGPETANFDYSPATIRDSVKSSLKRLQTPYLDTVYLHDVEYIAEPVLPKKSGNHTSALDDAAAEYGLVTGDEGRIWGDGDQKILDAFAALRELKDQGLIKYIGISGFPLPTLLRVCLLILHNAPFRPVDVVLSYSHLNLQNSSFPFFAPHLRERALVKQLLTASPLNMGLLSPSPPEWHPAPPALREAVTQAQSTWPNGLPNLAVGFAIRNTGGKANGGVPLVIGFSNPEEVHESMKVWREVRSGLNEDKRKRAEILTREVFKQAGFLDWSWSSP